jgi:hypothetical protein
VVLIDGQPLPNAYVEFVPQLTDFGAEMNSTGTTDEKGQFRLTCNEKQQPGAVVAKHRVLVTDPPMPQELRGQSEKAQIAAAEWSAKLKSRSIPGIYGTVVHTPLEVDVTREKKSYTLNLTRKQ